MEAIAMSKEERKSTKTEGAGHNSGARSQTIQDVCRRLTALESERKAISDDIRSLKQTEIKGNLGMKISDFNVALRLYQLEGDDRDELLSTVRETFEALGIGEQLDWLKADERSRSRTTEPVDEAGEKAAADAGPVEEAA